jgi:hypothetical protein
MLDVLRERLDGPDQRRMKPVPGVAAYFLLRRVVDTSECSNLTWEQRYRAKQEE